MDLDKLKFWKPDAEPSVSGYNAKVYDPSPSESSVEQTSSYQSFYEQLEIVNRAANMITDDAASIPIKVMPVQRSQPVYKGQKRTTVDRLLNKEPNPFQDINSFKRNLILDLLLDGNIFIYFDGLGLYQLPSEQVSIEKDEDTFIKSYIFKPTGQTYSPKEIIHIKENSFKSLYRGVPRIKPALRTMKLLYSLRSFQDNFFKNGAVPGLVLKSPNTLSEKIKERLLLSWKQKYNPKTGGRSPLILDGGLELDSIADVNFRELGFQDAIKEAETTILKAFGVPPILLDSGNNANIRPNMRLYYLETVVPIVTKLTVAMERFFGFEMHPDLTSSAAMQPELKELAQYHTSLVNGGIELGDEAREALGLDKLETEEMTTIRIPANIAGSAVDPSVGGRPDDGGEE